MFGFDYHVYCAEIMRFKAKSVETSDIRFSERAHPKQKAAITQHVSVKLSSLSCLIALKLSNTHMLILKTNISCKNTVGYVREGKQPERNLMLMLDVY